MWCGAMASSSNGQDLGCATTSWRSRPGSLPSGASRSTTTASSTTSTSSTASGAPVRSTTRSEGRHRGGQPVDAAHGRRGCRRRPRPPDRRARLPRTPRRAGDRHRRRPGRARPDDVAVIVPVTTIVGDSDEEIAPGSRHGPRVAVVLRLDTRTTPSSGTKPASRAPPSASAPNRRPATWRVWRPRSPTTTSPCLCTEAHWDDLADALVAKYDGIVDRLVFYNPAFDTPDRFERYGAVARAISDRSRADEHLA